MEAARLPMSDRDTTTDVSSQVWGGGGARNTPNKPPKYSEIGVPRRGMRRARGHLKTCEKYFPCSFVDETLDDERNSQTLM